MKQGLFIVIDGIDGSGKTEIVKMLHNYLFTKNKKYRILATREPTNGSYGKKIREMLRKENDPISNSEKLTELFMKDREEHLSNTIEPFLNRSSKHELNIVICDRYYYSTIAFQGAQGLNAKGLIKKNMAFRKPDMAFILDVEPSLALKRIEYRRREKFEQLEFMKKIRKNFLLLPKLLEDNIKIINASKPLNDVFAAIKKEIENILAHKTY
ncbi:dTMP kinase [Candidatus Woesearchaeota archaeon]|nr:dTMP kinase [Candidatus Woesearchaeota archaeon]